jgi:hypothetical protein
MEQPGDFSSRVDSGDRTLPSKIDSLRKIDVRAEEITLVQAGRRAGRFQHVVALIKGSTPNAQSIFDVRQGSESFLQLFIFCSADPHAAALQSTPYPNRSGAESHTIAIAILKCERKIEMSRTIGPRPAGWPGTRVRRATSITAIKRRIPWWSHSSRVSLPRMANFSRPCRIPVWAFSLR